MTRLGLPMAVGLLAFFPELARGGAAEPETAAERVHFTTAHADGVIILYDANVSQIVTTLSRAYPLLDTKVSIFGNQELAVECVNAIRVAGHVRARDAAMPVALHIELFDKSKLAGQRLLLPDELFPAIPALISIGRPAIDGVLEAIASRRQTTQQGLRNCLYVFKQLDDKQTILSVLSASIARVSEEPKRERLRALESFVRENWNLTGRDQSGNEDRK